MKHGTRLAAVKLKHPWFRKAIQVCAVIADRLRQRQMLAELSDEMLKDIGVSRADVDGECRKKFWQA